MTQRCGTVPGNDVTTVTDLTAGRATYKQSPVGGGGGVVERGGGGVGGRGGDVKFNVLHISSNGLEVGTHQVTVLL